MVVVVVARSSCRRGRWTGTIRLVVMMMMVMLVVIRRGRGRAVAERRRDALLLLPSIAEPDAHHLLLELQLIRQLSNVLGGRLRIASELRLQRLLDADLDRRTLLALASARCDLLHGIRRARLRFRIFEPLGEQRTQLAHVLEAQLQGLEPADGRLTEYVAVEVAQGEAHVGLRVAQFNTSLFELLGEAIEIVVVDAQLMFVVVAATAVHVARRHEIHVVLVHGAVGQRGRGRRRRRARQLPRLDRMEVMLVIGCRRRAVRRNELMIGEVGLMVRRRKDIVRRGIVIRRIGRRRWPVVFDGQGVLLVRMVLHDHWPCRGGSGVGGTRWRRRVSLARAVRCCIGQTVAGGEEIGVAVAVGFHVVLLEKQIVRRIGRRRVEERIRCRWIMVVMLLMERMDMMVRVNMVMMKSVGGGCSSGGHCRWRCRHGRNRTIST